MTRYELFRRRIAPILFLGLVGWIMYDAWKKEKGDESDGTVVIELGQAEPRVREVEADLFVNGTQVGVFRRTALPGAQIGPCRFEAHMPSPDGELRVVVDVDGTRRRFTRAVHIADGATVRVDLGPALAEPAAAPPAEAPAAPPVGSPPAPPAAQ